MKNFKFTINGNKYEVEIADIEDKTAEVTVNGTTYNVEMDREVKTTKTPRLVRSKAVPSTDSVASTQRTAAPGATAIIGTIKSPLPGTILDIHVREGASVSVGTKLMTLEAMKMENVIKSDKDGIVKTIKFDKGDSVMEGDVLIEIGG